MKNEIITFKNEMFGEVRTMCDEQGEPWFVGKDVAEVLGYERPDNAIRNHVDDDDKLMHQISASGQRRKMTIINESGLYSLIMASKLPQAKAFKHWVTSEVLPQIRKTGGYIPVGKGDDEKMILAKTVKILMKTVAQKEEVGRARLFSWLRRHGYMFKDSRMPIQKWVEKGLFEVEETILKFLFIVIHVTCGR